MWGLAHSRCSVNVMLERILCVQHSSQQRLEPRQANWWDLDSKLCLQQPWSLGWSLGAGRVGEMALIVKGVCVL